MQQTSSSSSSSGRSSSSGSSGSGSGSGSSSNNSSSSTSSSSKSSSNSSSNRTCVTIGKYKMNVTGPVLISEMISSELVPSSCQNSAEINPAFWILDPCRWNRKVVPKRR
jgi:hypothetical protein